MTSGRTSIAAGAVAAAGATVAMFAAANMVGHTLGYDLWPMFDGDGSRVIEVPAASPNGPGVNPLLPTGNPLTRSAPGESTAPGPVVFGTAVLPTTPVVGIGGVGTLPRTSASGSAERSRRRSSSERRSGSGRTGSSGSSAPSRPSTSAPAASTPVQSTAPAASSNGSVTDNGRPSGSSSEGSSSGGGSSSSGANAKSNSGKSTTSKPTAPAQATPPSPGQAKKADPAPVVAAPSTESREGTTPAAAPSTPAATGTPGSPEAPPAPGQEKGGG